MFNTYLFQSPKLKSFYFEFPNTGTKLKNDKIIKRIWNFIGVLLLVILGILAILYSKGSIDAYYVQKTSLSHDLQPILNHPTFTLCFGVTRRLLMSHFSVLNLGVDFNVTVTQGHSEKSVR